MQNYSFDSRILESYIPILGEQWRESLRRIINTYLVEAPEILQKIKSGLNHKNFEEIKQAAHSLKSSTAAIGAMSDSELCTTIEKYACESNFNRIQRLVEHLERHHENTAWKLNELQIKWVCS
ncbi:MAG: Hpt domain-containing protein [Cyanobacteria bacterium P01_F01_bin.150]